VFSIILHFAAPPLWAGSKDPEVCNICNAKPTFLQKIHHCRNCGYYVCVNCSAKNWPSSMLPPTYHFREKIVRICDCCQALTDIFVRALRSGNLERSIAAFTTGNVSLYCPFSIYKSEEYAIHSVAVGGNVKLAQWLIEGRQCSLHDNTTGAPLTTTDGLTALAIAAKYGRAELMKYLIKTQKCSLNEIKNLQSLKSGLLAALGPSSEVFIIIYLRHHLCIFLHIDCKFV
jgi:FYVE zinc finger/Ankyrin repeats (3 copies)